MGDPRTKDSVIQLKSGTTTEDPRLDRVDQKDHRSRDYDISETFQAPLQRKPRSYTWRPDVPLNQGFDGACVGFAWAHELRARPARVEGITAQFAREKIYYSAQKIDRFPGGAYPGAMPFLDGTSILAGAKVIQSLGYIAEYRWAFTLYDCVLAIGYKGPVVFGCRWTKGMNEPGDDGFIRPTGRNMGKHAILLFAVKVVFDANQELSETASYCTLQNSWGTTWGRDGCAKIRLSDLRKLWDGAESCVPIGRKIRPLPHITNN